MRVAVAGGSGVAGRAACRQLSLAGHVPVALSRSAGFDLTRPDDAAAGLRGAEAVLDATNVVTLRAGPAVAFFEQVTRTLLDASRAAGVARYVLLSIIGADRVGAGYYLGKVRQEELATSSPLDTRVLRSSQFHDFALQMADRMTLGPVALVPDMLCAPVAVDEVARRLVEVITGECPDPLVELAGPEVRRVPTLVREADRRRPRHRVVVPVRPPGHTGRLLRGGALLPVGEVERGHQTYGSWLGTRFPPPPGSGRDA